MDGIVASKCEVTESQSSSGHGLKMGALPASSILDYSYPPQVCSH